MCEQIVVERCAEARVYVAIFSHHADVRAADLQRSERSGGRECGAQKGGGGAAAGSRILSGFSQRPSSSCIPPNRCPILGYSRCTVVPLIRGAIPAKTTFASRVFGSLNVTYVNLFNFADRLIILWSLQRFHFSSVL